MKQLLMLFLGLLLFMPARAQMLPHPRLLEQPRPLEADAPWYARQVDSTVAVFSREVLDLPPVERTLTGRRLLGVSREALKRIFWLSYTYRTRGGEQYARRAIEEMLSVSRFTDWNPSHFLDVGEMTMALAIGYDWLYGQMNSDERRAVAEAILEKGLRPALEPDNAWFYSTEINWNSVCNAGMVYGALAVWEEDPDFCAQMLEKSLESSKLAFNAYSPEGGFPEGYNYWGYGTSFQIMLEAAVAPFAGDRIPERFFRSARFMQFMSSPGGRCFNFSDSYTDARFQYMQAWMAARTGDRSLLYPELRLLWGGARAAEERLLPMFLLYLPSGADAGIPREHVYTCGGTTPVYIYREDWTSAGSDYLGIKGGLSMSSHSHMDQGSFFFESGGVAWATDLGMQDYNSLESVGLDLWGMTQDSERWEVFRIGPWSHNIVTVNGNAPKVNHKASFSAIWADGPRRGAALDLGALYDDDLASCTREVYLEGGTLHVVDNLEAGEAPCRVRWAMCTEASARIEDGAIVLEADGKTRVLRAPEGLEPHIWPASYPGEHLHAYDVPNPGKSIVGFTLTLQARERRQLHLTL